MNTPVLDFDYLY